MEVKGRKYISIEESETGCTINFPKCPRCGLSYNRTDRKRTKHHAIPSFMNPIKNIIMDLCLKCHEELNESYNLFVIRNRKHRSENFQEFHQKYEDLRESFTDKKITRGEFGEGLWTNLVSYLEEQDKRIRELMKENKK